MSHGCSPFVGSCTSSRSLPPVMLELATDSGAHGPARPGIVPRKIWPVTLEYGLVIHAACPCTQVRPSPSWVYPARS